MVVMIDDVQIDIATHLLMADVFMTDSVKYSFGSLVTITKLWHIFISGIIFLRLATVVGNGGTLRSVRRSDVRRWSANQIPSFSRVCGCTSTGKHGGRGGQGAGDTGSVCWLPSSRPCHSTPAPSEYEICDLRYIFVLNTIITHFVDNQCFQGM